MWCEGYNSPGLAAVWRGVGGERGEAAQAAQAGQRGPGGGAQAVLAVPVRDHQAADEKTLDVIQIRFCQSVRSGLYPDPDCPKDYIICSEIFSE